MNKGEPRQETAMMTIQMIFSSKNISLASQLFINQIIIS